jgi:hypothetical protein
MRQRLNLWIAVHSGVREIILPFAVQPRLLISYGPGFVPRTKALSSGDYNGSRRLRSGSRYELLPGREWRSLF